MYFKLRHWVIAKCIPVIVLGTIQKQFATLAFWNLFQLSSLANSLGHMLVTRAAQYLNLTSSASESL